MSTFDPDRRKVLMASGTALTVAIAGCGGGGNGGGDGGDGSSSDDGSGDGGDGSSGDDGSGDGGDGGGGDVPQEVADHLSDANGYDGSVADMTGEDSVTVVNGANEPDYAFDPAAIRVSTGTEVTWEWAADVSHSVKHDNGEAFDSGIQGGADTTFSHTFEEAGTYLYVCVPHQSVGQLGAVVVE